MIIRSNDDIIIKFIILHYSIAIYFVFHVPMSCAAERVDRLIVQLEELNADLDELVLLSNDLNEIDSSINRLL